MEITRGLEPVGVIDEVVPIRNLVVDRAAAMAIGDAAIHAACGLLLNLGIFGRQHEFAKMANPLVYRRVVAILPLDLQKPCNLPHTQSFSAASAAASICTVVAGPLKRPWRSREALMA